VVLQEELNEGIVVVGPVTSLSYQVYIQIHRQELRSHRNREVIEKVVICWFDIEYLEI
jgi:hypothetical protein